MKKIILVLACILLVAIFFSVAVSNNLVCLREDTKMLYSNVENMLQRRFNLTPNILACVKGAITHREKIFVQIDAAKKELASGLESNDVAKIDEANNAITSIFKDLLVIVEGYPDIKSSEQFRAFEAQLKGSENRIRIAKERYNAKVAEYNTTVNGFFTRIVAGICGFQAIEYFSTE